MAQPEASPEGLEELLAAPNMRREIERRSSFLFHCWPEDADIGYVKLSQAGFFYEGNGDQVRCFACGGRYENWNENDQAMTVHQIEFPDCPFVRNPVQTGNIPVAVVEVPDSPGRINRDRYSAEMQNQEARLLTYRLRRWPKSSIVHPIELARAGFYYEGRSDIVRCAFCNGRLQDWTLGDRPMIEHRSHFPRCSFVLQQISEHSTSNPDLIGIDIAGASRQNRPSTPPDTKNRDDFGVLDVTLPTLEQRRMKELGIFAQTPCNGQLATLQARVQSFVGWPPEIKQRPHDLAIAGFFYTGQGDSVKCFHCDGGLRNWVPTDSPFTEHAKWFAHCEYLRLSKGDEFISNVQSNKSSPQSATPSVSSIQFQPSIAFPSKFVDLIEFGVNVDNEHLHMVKDMGYEEKLIVEAIIANGYRLFGSVERLVDKIEQIRYKCDIQTSVSVSPSSSLAVSNDSGADSPSVDDSTASSSIAPPAVLAGSLATDAYEQRICKICMDAEVSIVILPCGHLCCCPICAPALQQCPICRKEIKGFVRTYMA